MYFVFRASRILPPRNLLPGYLDEDWGPHYKGPSSSSPPTPRPHGDPRRRPTREGFSFLGRLYPVPVEIGSHRGQSKRRPLPPQRPAEARVTTLPRRGRRQVGRGLPSVCLGDGSVRRPRGPYPRLPREDYSDSSPLTPSLGVVITDPSTERPYRRRWEVWWPVDAGRLGHSPPGRKEKRPKGPSDTSTMYCANGSS